MEDSAGDGEVEEEEEDSAEDEEMIAVDVAVVLTGATAVVMTAEDEIGKCYTRITINHPEETSGDFFKGKLKTLIFFLRGHVLISYSLLRASDFVRYCRLYTMLIGKWDLV